MQSLTLLSQMIRRKLGGGPQPRDVFRPGMFLSLSAIPFLLSDDTTHIAAPEIDAADVKLNVGNVSHFDCGDLQLARLYVPPVDDQAGFFQIELDGQGEIAECRFFREIDLIYPATEDEWFLWVNPYWGRPLEFGPGDPNYPRALEVSQMVPMIGHPQFQLTDGTLFGRHWSPSDYSIDPFLFTETELGMGGGVEARRNWQAMLYSRALDLPSPAPQAEYILAGLVEEGDNAWISINCGIDIPASSISAA
jgi:hypothetical protein